MIPGLTTASAGMDVDERLEQLLSNNLANQETPGFKESLGEFIEDPVQNMEHVSYGSGASGTYIGQMGTGVVFQEGVPVFSEGAVQSTGRALDLAIIDSLPAGPMAYVVGASGAQPTSGPVSVGPNNRLSVNGQPLAVYDANGQQVTGLYAVRNSKYQGNELVGTDGSPDYDAGGNPSYVIANAQGQVVYTPGALTTDPYSIRVGTTDNMGYHSFFPVNYTDANGNKGIAVTRDGALQLDANNNLVDAAGHTIMPIGANGQPIVGGRIEINPAYQGTQLFGANGQALVDTSGQPSYRVYNANNQIVPGAHLGLVNADVTHVSPLGEGELMVGNGYSTAGVLPLLQTGTGHLQAGALEQSNVDPTTTMTQMLNAVNLYQANQRVVQTVDSLLNTAVNDIGKVNGA
ncbi:Flagellar basal body rod FlgEFG protein C-terminal [Alicyclobacillus hesperidum]|uniref:Flagellar basal body rod FlgEFG protein C-terminal n=1 Tax=Alicyclobacillus hesperidum TaxID=89784 RepID=A0A1H2XB58_9BACL|nr:flagellar basal body rod C-terminal domain-containing protein [Alicyclobacillus hesperidum]SDW90047.1 Flagellar basal body rod FlgEFG protein C-terminal [Alicyclobacillus hesperidum]